MAENDPGQREVHLKQCFSNPLDKLRKSDDIEEELIDEGEGDLSVTYDESVITTVSRSNLRQMWCYATKILHQDQGIMTVPWDSTASQENGL